MVPEDLGNPLKGRGVVRGGKGVVRGGRGRGQRRKSSPRAEGEA